MTKYSETISQVILEQIRKGTAPWQKPWDPNKVRSAPFNPITGNPYKGFNNIWLSAQRYQDPRWITYKQAQSLGAQVKKGEKSTQIQYWKWTEEKRVLDEKGNPKLDQDGQPLTEKVRLRKPQQFLINVFNAEQIDGLEPFKAPTLTFSPIKKAEEIINSVDTPIVHDQLDQCFYGTRADKISMVPKEAFKDAYEYYAVIIHEIGHSTGHPSRLNRDLSGPFGSEKYAKEELRAEISSFMINTEVGLGHQPERHASYIESWMKVIKEDPNVLFKAASDAEKIKEYILHPEKRQELVKAAQVTKAVQRDEKLSSEKSNARTYLDVSFKEKETAKEAGAKWDKAAKSWYAPEGVDIKKFEKWLPKAEEKQMEAVSPPKTKAAQRVYLNVEYSEKEAAKEAGARWDRKNKSWYLPENADMADPAIQKWLPQNQPKPEPKVSPEQEFKEFLEQQGLKIEGMPVMNGKHQRVQTIDDKGSKKSASYIGYLDGVPSGVVTNFKVGDPVKWVFTGSKLTQAERAEMARTAQVRREQQARETEATHKHTAKRAYGIYQNAKKAEQQHPYLQRKGVEAHGLKQDGHGNLLVPMRDAKGFQFNNQTITENGDKLFMRDGRKKGLFHQIGAEKQGIADLKKVIIAEGYATAASIHKATGYPVLVAFDAGNLMPVAKSIRALNPNVAITIAADNDHEKTWKPTQQFNVGVEKAKEAAVAVGGDVIIPKFTAAQIEKGLTDFNDLHKDTGLKAVQKAFQTKPPQQDKKLAMGM
jgi:antirestriction protein ArdC/phage/plasmid primase-like uncharacterized protein